jgi:hypothetical protein
VYRHDTLTRRTARPALLLALACCHRGSSSAPAPVAQVRFVPADPRHCLPSEPVAPANPDVARACAEAFVLRNGYTPARAPRDTTLLARESFEIGTWDLLSEKRRYTIEPKALLADCDAAGCIVYFRRFVRSQGCLAVSMSSDYDRLQFGRPAEVELVRRSAQLRCT